MELFQLRAFLTVAEELHFGRAARRLGIAQSPLSRSIRQLEDEMGAELFYRTTRSVELSPAGEALLEPALLIIKNCDALGQSVRLASTGNIGFIRFGFSGASLNRLVAKLASTAQREYPGITLRPETTTYAEEGLARLRDSTLDLALVRWTETPANITGRAVLVERPVVAVYKGHALAERDMVTINDLGEEPLILLPSYPMSSMRRRIASWFDSAGITPNIAHEVPDSWLIGAMIKERMGITITYDSVMAGLDDSALVSIPLNIEDTDLRVYLAHRTDDENPALKNILKVAEAALPTVE